MKFARSIGCLMLCSALAIASGCSDSTDSSSTYYASALTASPTSSCETVELLAGQHTVIGEVEVCEVSDDLEITYRITESNWCLEETHLQVADDPGGFPTAGRWGNPVPGQFDYGRSYSSDACEVEDTFTVSGASSTGVIAAHAAVRLESEAGELLRTETAWGADVKLEEQLYLSDGEASTIYAVDLNDDTGKATLEPLTTLQDFEEAHIGHAADERVIYAVDKTGMHFGLYDIDADTLDGSGAIDNAPQGLIAVATSPEGTLYVVSQNDDHLYKLAFNGGTPSLSVIGDTGIDIDGADIAFTADGTLYLWTNNNSDRGLYTVDLDSGAATKIGPTSSSLNLTGLAVRNGGYGDLVGSEARSGTMHIIDRETGEVTATFSLQIGNEGFHHSYGDMTMGIFERTILDYGTRFTERGNWGTYFEYSFEPSEEAL